MKPSSSSTTLAFFDSNRSGSGGCILSVLKRILCSRNLPSDTCSCSDDKMMKDDNKDVVVPGLVARLMGLDSIPERRITRSRSLNSADDFQNRSKLQLHKRSKSSREIHSYIELDDDDDDFIVLKFDNRKKSSRTNQKRVKTVAVASSPETLKEEQKQHGRLLQNAQVANAKQLQQQPTEEANSRIKKQIRLDQKTTQSTSSDTEESSPVSTLDFQEPTSDDDSWTRSSSSSSRVSSPEQDNTKISTSLIDHQNPEAAVERRHKVALLNNTVVVHFNDQKKKREMWDKICNITVAEIKGAATHIEDTYYYWVKEDLAAEFEVHIMDQLLNDLVLLLHLHSI